MAGQCGSTCPVQGGFYSYNPSVGGNATLLIIYAIIVPIVFYLGLRYRTPLFATTLITGLLFEVLGFIGRLLLHGAQDYETYFLLSQLGTVLGPTFMSIAIFFVLPHILSVYGEHLVPFRPLDLGFVFYSFTVLAGILELIGVILVTYGFQGISRTKGADVVAAGLGIQSAMLLVFSALHFWFTLGLSTRREGLDGQHSRVYSSPRFKRFIMALQAATILLIVYSIYRLVEFTGDVSGGLFQNEAAFMVIGGAFPLLVCVLLSVYHPGAAFGDAWSATSPRQRRGLPEPIDTGLPIHHRYDPQIRSQISPMSQKHLRGTLSPPQPPAGSPGLPANPKPLPKAAHSHASPAPSSRPTSYQDQNWNYHARFERQSQIPKKDLVRDDELW